MKIYPAIDIKDGKCVRLYQGRADKVTEYGNSPKNMALLWMAQGAKQLHLVDLDGAFTGQGPAREAILDIRRATDLPLQVGGGIRSSEDVETYLQAGIDRVIVGTMAVKAPDRLQALVKKYKDRIVVSVDVKDDYVTTDGWVNASGIKTTAFLEKLNQIGVQTIVLTDISKDGAMTGPNLEVLIEANKVFSGTVIASGGVSKLQDLIDLSQAGLTDAIVGKALYEGTINLGEAQAYLK
ncbi:1-(5-phosphoribosyl)-5-[(5-phosphoribosylamino)methylideneamino]imidazole-4-carboxamide isomerase [Fusibacter sp. JL216-2]|uniref:1-(5-phosphoribosyl)-5-[(5- phosphoribosylamino)methylideneamino]imidazole-4- carboxamide isomerase n=1 Tax=Fusibacter sp. JL216-2 TaxID=3071453 RepID=UPI003D3322BD